MAAEQSLEEQWCPSGNLCSGMRHAGIAQYQQPATVLLTWKILQVVLFIYLIKHQPNSTCTNEFLCEASEESHGCSSGALGETAAVILDSDPF